MSRRLQSGLRHQRCHPEEQIQLALRRRPGPEIETYIFKMNADGRLFYYKADIDKFYILF
jgi:hypothetical protein